MLEGFLPQMPPLLTLLGVVLVLFLLCLLSYTPGRGQDPPGPRPLPLLGNLLLLDLKHLHLSLCKLSKKYGSVFTIHLGPRKVVVLAGYRTVKQALVNYAKEFGDREISPMFADVAKGHGVLFANGNSWKKMRRFSYANLRNFGMGKRGSEEKIIEEFRCLIELSKKYGSVFTIHLGPRKVVVLAGYRTVKQALVNYAKEFGDREISPMFADVAKGHGVLFANGNSWKKMRRFSYANLRNFGMGKRGSEEKIIEEFRCLIEVFENFKGEPFDTTQPVNYSVSNIICAIVYGTRFDYADPAFQKMVERANKIIRLAGSAEIQLYNMFPWLRWCCGRLLMNRTQILKNTEKNIEEIKGLVQGLRDTLNSEDLRGFVDSFLVRQQEELDQLGSYFHNNNLHQTIGNLFAAGTDTTENTLRWGLLLMAKYPHIQDQVQEELSRVIGDREPRMEDRRNLPYTDAVIHEIQRLANIVPMSLPHTTSCDVTFQGYIIKKGTMVIPLLTSVLQDEEEWETPHSFNPGHFLDEKGCFIKRDSFMPFSAGRRACLGESLARMELFLFFTFLLQRFRFTPPPGVSEDELDLTPTVGLTLSPSPHRLCAVSRA